MARRMCRLINFIRLKTPLTCLLDTSVITYSNKSKKKRRRMTKTHKKFSTDYTEKVKTVCDRSTYFVLCWWILPVKQHHKHHSPTWLIFFGSQFQIRIRLVSLYCPRNLPTDSQELCHDVSVKLFWNVKWEKHQRGNWLKQTGTEPRLGNTCRDYPNPLISKLLNCFKPTQKTIKTSHFHTWFPFINFTSQWTGPHVAIQSYINLGVGLKSWGQEQTPKGSSISH